MMKAAEPTSVLYHHNHQNIHRREGAAASSLDTDASCSFNKYVSQCRQPTMPPATVIAPVNTFRDTSKAASSLLMRAATCLLTADMVIPDKIGPKLPIIWKLVMEVDDRVGYDVLADRGSFTGDYVGST
jgi:hypothetical protein